MEIEKKYKVKYLPPLTEAAGVKKIEQGYLCREPVVRIRKSNEDYILTYKSAQKGNSQRARVCQEVEVPLSPQGYEHLKEKIDDYLIEKTRYIFPLPQGRKAELDIFQGRLQGIQLVEVEFSSEKEAEGFLPPDWFGEEVSFDLRYVNSFLSQIATYEEWLQARP